MTRITDSLTVTGKGCRTVFKVDGRLTVRLSSGPIRFKARAAFEGLTDQGCRANPKD